MTTSAPAVLTEITGPALVRMPHVRVISMFDDFVELEPVWNNVLAQADITHPFLEHAWVRTWLECFGGKSSLRMLVVMSGDEPIAIAPLILTPVRMWGISVRRLGFPYNDHVPRADFIVARGHEEAYDVIWNHLRRNREWDLLQLCQLPADSETLAQLLTSASVHNYRAGVWVSGASPCIPLRGSWTEYYEGLAAKHRSNLRNRFKRLDQIGPVELETVSKGDQVYGALEQGLELEAAAWKRGEGTAISCDPYTARFYTALAQRAAKVGWLRLNFLRAGATRIAFDYSLAYKDQIFLLKLGYNPEFSAYSPSNLLLSLALKDAFDRGLTGYDFLGDQADWKKCWAKASTAQVWLFVFPKTFKGHLLHFVKFQFFPLVRKPWLRPVRDFILRIRARFASGGR